MERKTFTIIDGKRLRKLPKSKIFRKTKPQKPTALKKVPSSFSALKEALSHIWQYRRLFIGVILVYVMLMLLFVKGLSNTIDINALRQELAQTTDMRGLSQNLALTGVVASSGGNSQSDVANVYQSVILIISVLAFIWLFRQTSHEKVSNKLQIRQSFYEGMEQIVPFILVLFVVGLQLLPMLIGFGIFNIVQTNGLASTITETILWGFLALLLSTLTLYLISSSVFALIIVTLSKERPIQALRSAKKLTAFRRTILMRRLLTIVLALFLGTALMLLLVITVAPVLAEYTFLLLGALIIPIFIGSLFKIYRAIL